MRPFQWISFQRERKGDLKIIKRQALPYALILISNWQMPAAKTELPEQQINCLMTVKDIRVFENIDEQILSDWFI
jgi:hypothetical protein